MGVFLQNTLFFITVLCYPWLCNLFCRAISIGFVASDNSKHTGNVNVFKVKTLSLKCSACSLWAINRD